MTVDTSAVLAVAAGEPTRAVLAKATRGADLVAPSSLPAEVGNALSAMLTRGRIAADGARRAVSAYRAIPIRLLDIDLSGAVALAARLGIYAYDAYVIDCALKEGAPLLTIDGGQRAAAERVGIPLHPY